MIDARDYKTLDELEEAMQYEHDISELDAIDKTLDTLEFQYYRVKSSYEEFLYFLNKEKGRLLSSIEHYKSTHDIS
jgi:hypothetical protein